MGRLQLSFPIQLLLAGLAGALLAMSYSLQPFWWAAWLAPVPLIVAALAATRQRRRVICVLAGVIAGAATLSYHSVVGSWPTALLILVLRAAGWMWVLSVVVRAAERWRTAAAVFVLPMAWAGLETLIIHFSPHSSGGSLAYSQMDFLPVVQIASLGGVPAVVFVVLLFGSWAGFLVARFLGLAHLRGLPAASVAVALIVFGVLAFGFVRLREGADRAELQVALITTDGLRPPRDWASFWSVYGPEVQNAAHPGVVVVLPEAVVQLTNVEADAAAVQLAQYAQAQGSTLVVGIVVTDDGAKTNRALVVKPSGAISWYLKQHLVPGTRGRHDAGKAAVGL
jgi:apolipoprotein N-acyltransferase